MRAAPRRGEGPDELERDLEAFGLQLEGEDPDQAREQFDVWPENREAVQLFVELGTQWRLAVGFGVVRYLGLDYAAVAAHLALRGRARNRNRGRLHEALRVMERAALDEFDRLPKNG